MANLTTHGSYPYYDDFDATKNFLRILFNPGRPPQARELTQAQTILQNQVGMFADHVFKQGSMVIPGSYTLDNRIGYVKVESSFLDASKSPDPFNTTNYYDEFVGTTITGETTGVTAEVVYAMAETDSDPITLFVRYASANGAYSEFSAEEIVSSDADVVRYAQVQASAETPIGRSVMGQIAAGIYYVRGCFVQVATQRIIASKYDIEASFNLVLSVTENTITAGDDSSLYDKSIGTPNYGAPGAHRYKISLTLASEDYDPTQRTSDDFILLAAVNEGLLVRSINEPQYSEIMKVLARRTYEESGDYALNPFSIVIKDSQSSPDTKLTAELSPSMAYVRGYRVGAISNINLEIDKAQDTASYNNAIIQGAFGNYILVDGITGIPDVDNYGKITLKDDTVANGGGSTVGTARTRGLTHHSGTPGTAACRYKLYLFDISIPTASPQQTFSDVRSIYAAGTPALYADVYSESSPHVTEIYQSSRNTGLFKLPVGSAESITDVTAYLTQVYDSGSITFQTPNYVLQLSAGTNKLFVSTTTTDYACVIKDAGAPGSPSYDNGAMVNPTSVTLTGSPLGSGVTINFGTDSNLNGLDMSVTTKIAFSGSPKTKTLTTVTDEAVTITAASYYELDNEDGHSLTSILAGSGSPSNGEDVTSFFTFSNGQRENFYGPIRINLKKGKTLPSSADTLWVTYRYFAHSGGAYFNVDSYSSVGYDEIPNFTKTDGSVVSLADVLDFRPSIDNTGAVSDETDMVWPNSLFSGDVSYYLPRADVICLTSDGMFRIEKGIPRINPLPPKAPSDSMALWNLYLNPYTATVRDVRSEYVDNRRYTMRHIGALEKRIRNLEYYTTLSLLERSASDLQIYDGTGNLRFKNGFVVDNFHGTLVAYEEHPDWKATLDLKKGLLKPFTKERQVELTYDSVSSDTVQSSRLVTLPFDDVAFITQPYASSFENVNPYLVFYWSGMIVISPMSDEWVDTVTMPVRNVDLRAYSAEQIAEIEGRPGSTIEVISTDISTDRFNEGGLSGTKTTTTDLVRETYTTVEDVVHDAGDRVVDVSWTPYIRPRMLYFVGYGFKPGTQVYPFFNGIDVSDWCRSPAGSLPSINPSEYTVEEAMDLTEHPEGSTDLRISSTGLITGTFFIPASTFTTGQSEFKLIDSATNSNLLSKTSGTVSYFTRGLTQNVENLSISTQELAIDTRISTRTTESIERDPVEPISPTVTSDWGSGVSVAGFDPLAQSFRSPIGGVFITGFDIYFKSAPTTELDPVYFEIVRMFNGYPTAEVLPYSKKALFGTSVSVSDDASEATNVEFEAPIYVPEGEWALVIISQSQDYEVWVSELGEYDVLSGQRIVTQATLGSLFKSQNKSTWTADQFKDLKYTMYRADFDTSSSVDAVFENSGNLDDRIPNSPFLTSASSPGANEIRVTHPNHGMFNGSKVRISAVKGYVTTSGASGTFTVGEVLTSDSSPAATGKVVAWSSPTLTVSQDASEVSVPFSAGEVLTGGTSAATATISSIGTFNGVPYSEIVGDHDVSDVECDRYTVTVTTDATASGSVGGAGVKASTNYTVNSFILSPNQLIVSRTGIDWVGDFTTGKSLAGSETPFQTLSSVNIIPNSVTRTENPLVVMSTVDEADNLSAAKSLTLTATLSSESSWVSPVIDLNMPYLDAIFHRIDNPADAAASGYNVVDDFTEETDPYLGSALSKYITREWSLNDPAESLTVYLTASVPSVASVEVYYKVRELGDDTKFDDLGWTGPVDPDTAIVYKDDPSDYDEISYTIDETDLGSIQFTSFAVKLVMKSQNGSKIPTIKDLRVIGAT